MARGIRSGADAVRVLIDGTPTTDFFNEMKAGADLINNDRDSLVSFLTFPTTVSAHAVLQSSDTMQFERATEYGEPVSSRIIPASVQVGYPLSFFDLRMSMTWKYLLNASAEQVRADIGAAYEADNRLVFQAIMTTLLDPAPGVNENGVPVYGLYSGDGFVPPAYRGKTFTGTHTHYLTTGGAFDGTDLAAAMDTITEHGYGGAAGGQLLVFVNPQESKTIQTFRATSGGVYDFIPSQGAPAYLSSTQIVGSTAPAAFGRVPVVGSFGAAYISESLLIPAGYVLVVATDGANSARNPVGFREHPRPEYRGLRAIPGSNGDYPLQDAFFARFFGTGVRHRGAAAVMQVTTATTYTAPAAFKRGSY